MAIAVNVPDRLWDGDITGLIGGRQRRRPKLIGVILAFVVFQTVRVETGFIAGFGAVILFSALAGLVLRLRKHAAGASMDSVEY